MKLPRWSLLLLLPLALVSLLLLAGIMALVLATAPPAVSAAALVLGALLVLWFIFGRRRSPGVLPGSESALMGRQASKEGLL